MAGEGQVAAFGQGPRAVHERLGAPRQRADLPSDLGFARGLEMRGLAVPPAAVQPPDIAHDVLRLVVDGLEIGAPGEVRGRANLGEDLVEREAGIHARHRLALEGLEPFRRIAERLSYARGAHDRRAVTRDQELG